MGKRIDVFPAQADPVAVAAVFAEALDRLPVLRPRWVRAGPGQAPPQRARATGRPRLTLVTAGCRRVLAPVDGVVGEQALRPGEALVVAPGGWSLPLPSPPHRFLVIDCDDDGTRFAACSAEPAAALAFHSSGPLHPAAWALLLAVIHLGDDPGLRPLASGVLPSAIRAALADCRSWPGADPARLAWARARAWAREHLDCGRQALAAAAGVHPNHLSRLCRRLEGTGLLAWLTEQRLARARGLLRGGLPVAAVARACGYGDPRHFRRIFRARIGRAPAAWAAGRSAG